MICLLHDDPDLARIDNNILPKIMQTIYVATGCDYTSFFSQIGKATFLRYYFQYASFITGGIDSTPGTLAHTLLSDGSYKLGYLAFVRLVGTVYFKKHSSGFVTDSPRTHFANFMDQHLTSEQQHSRWLDDIRQTIWYRTKFENEMIASDEALLLHWKRTCWILHMWNQSDSSAMTLLPMTSYGWWMRERVVTVEWDTESNIRAIKHRVDLLTKGCKCTTSCSTNRCGCRKKGNKCSLGCECINCINTENDASVSPVSEEMREVAIEEEHATSPVDEIMDLVFGATEDEAPLSQRELQDSNYSSDFHDSDSDMTTD